MKRTLLSAALAAMSVLGGCGYSGPRHAMHADRDMKWGSKPRPEYREFSHGDKIYVVSSEASETKIKSGTKLTNKWVAFGAGPKGETVVFETSKEGQEGYLIEDYEKKHGVKLQ